MKTRCSQETYCTPKLLRGIKTSDDLHYVADASMSEFKGNQFLSKGDSWSILRGKENLRAKLLIGMG